MTKKILAVVLALVMAMSCLCVEVFAADTEEIFSVTVKPTVGDYGWCTALMSKGSDNINNFIKAIKTEGSEVTFTFPNKNDTWIQVYWQECDSWSSNGTHAEGWGHEVKCTGADLYKLVTDGSESVSPFKDDNVQLVMNGGFGEEIGSDKGTSMDVKVVVTAPKAAEPEVEHPEGEVEIRTNVVKSNEGQVNITLPNTVKVGDTVKVHVTGTADGDFRSWLALKDAAGNEETMCANPQWIASTNAGYESGKFDLTYDLVVAPQDSSSETATANILIFKGPTWDTPLSNFTIEHLGVVMPKREEEEEPADSTFAVQAGTALDGWIKLINYEDSNFEEVKQAFKNSVLEVSYTGDNVQLILQYNGTGENAWPGTAYAPTEVVDGKDGVKIAKFDMAQIIEKFNAETTDAAQDVPYDAVFAFALDGRTWLADGVVTAVYEGAKLSASSYVPGNHPEGETEIKTNVNLASSEFVCIKLPEPVKLGDTVTVHAIGESKGDFRVWLCKNDGGETMCADPAWKASEKLDDYTNFDFVADFVCTPQNASSATEEADYIMFKGPAWGTNLDSLTISHLGIVVTPKEDEPDVEPGENNLGIQFFIQDHAAWTWHGICDDFGKVTDNGYATKVTFKKLNLNNLPVTAANVAQGYNLDINFAAPEALFVDELKDAEIGATSTPIDYDFTYSDLVIKANGYNDVVVKGPVQRTGTWIPKQEDGWVSGINDTLNVLALVKEQLGISDEEVALKYVPALTSLSVTVKCDSIALQVEDEPTEGHPKGETAIALNNNSVVIHNNSKATISGGSLKMSGEQISVRLPAALKTGDVVKVHLVGTTKGQLRSYLLVPEDVWVNLSAPLVVSDGGDFDVVLEMTVASGSPTAVHFKGPAGGMMDSVTLTHVGVVMPGADKEEEPEYKEEVIYNMEHTDGQYFENKALPVKLAAEPGEDQTWCRIATNWVGNGEVYSAILNAIQTEDATLRITYTGDIKSFNLQSDGEMGEVALDSFKIEEVDGKKVATIATSEVYKAFAKAIAVESWHNFMLVFDGNANLYKFEVVKIVESKPPVKPAKKGKTFAYAIRLSNTYHGYLVNGRMISMPHTFGTDGVCTTCGYKKVETSYKTEKAEEEVETSDEAEAE